MRQRHRSRAAPVKRVRERTGGGIVRPGDAIRAVLPAGPHRAMERV